MIILSIVIGVLALGGILYWRSQAGPATPYDQAMAGLADRFRQTPGFAARFGVLSTAETIDVGMALATRGMARLPDPDLVQRLEFLDRFLGAADDAACAAVARGQLAFFRGQRSIPTTQAQFEVLGPQVFGALMELSLRAAAAELKNDPQPKQVSDEQVRQAAQVFTAAVPAADAPQMRAVLANIRTAPDADACRAARTYHRTLVKLSEPARSVLARAEIQSDGRLR